MLTSAQGATNYVVNHNDIWYYHKGTNPVQSSWRTLPDASLDDTWATGMGGFGYANSTGPTAETNNCGTILSDMFNNYTTVYMRKEFTIADSPDPSNHLWLRMDWDDGFIAWLDDTYLTNGNVAGAPNEPAYTDGANPSDHESSLGNSSPQNPAVAYDLGSVTNWLSPGTHTLCIVGLNGGSNSSDFIQVADLYTAPLPPPPPPSQTNMVVSHGDTWYYHKGTNPVQSSWRTLPDASLDGTWATGMGGFGYANNGGQTSETNYCGTILGDMYSRYTSLYMRKQFTITNSLDTSNRLWLRMDWDDGFIAWLDDTYLMSKNVAGAPNEPAYTGNASPDHESSLGNSSPQPAEAYDLGYATNWLTPGTHTLAIVGLNGGSTSSDFIQVPDLYMTPPPPPPPSNAVVGPINANTTLYAANGPYLVMNWVVINAQLIIEPGTTLQFASTAAGMEVSATGQLIAAGTPENRIRFTRQAASAARWSGFRFNYSHQSNVLAYADIEYADNASSCIYIYESQVLIDRDTFFNMTKLYLDIWFPQVIIRHSVFGDLGGAYFCKVENINPNGWFIVDGNLFGKDTGDNDIFHLNHVSLKGGPKAIVVNNVFTGAGDDIIDDNETDTHIEGNLFMNFTTSHPLRSASAAVTTGEGSGIGHNLTTQHLTVVRNIFWGNDYGILNKDGSYVQVYNSVFVNNRGAIIFDEPWRTDSGPGRGCYIEGSIFWGNFPENGTDQGTFAYLTNSDAYRLTARYHGYTQVTVNNSILPAEYHYLGTGNIEGDPAFVFPTNNLSLSPADPAFAKGFDGFDANAFLLTNHLIPDVHLLPGSAAIGTGVNGSDMGIYVSDDATITGEPPPTTSLDSATLTVAGLDMYGYRYRLVGDDFTNAWSPEIQAMKYVSQITLSGTQATATCTNHQFNNGDVIEVLGADSPCPYYNGLFTIANVTANTFDYTVSLGTNAPMNEPIMTYAEKRTDIWCRRPEQIQLTGLTNGTYHVETVRKNSMDIWQSTDVPTISKSWTVQAGGSSRFTSIQVITNACVLKFEAEAGQTYSILASDTLVPANWQKFTDIQAPETNSILEVIAPDVNSRPMRYFRLVSPAVP